MAGARAMTQAEATDFITSFAATADFPALAADELALIVKLARRPDSLRRQPGAADWTPTFNAEAGVALAWDMKAAKSAGKYTVTSGNQTLRRGDVHAHCLEQAAAWRKKAGEGVGTLVGWGAAAAVQGVQVAGVDVPFILTTDAADV